LLQRCPIDGDGATPTVIGSITEVDIIFETKEGGENVLA
jgi:hypothetical protein